MTLAPRNEQEFAQEQLVKDRADAARELKIATIGQILSQQRHFSNEVYQLAKIGLMKMSQRELNALQAMVDGFGH